MADKVYIMVGKVVLLVSHNSHSDKLPTVFKSWVWTLTKKTKCTLISYKRTFGKFQWVTQFLENRLFSAGCSAVCVDQSFLEEGISNHRELRWHGLMVWSSWINVNVNHLLVCDQHLLEYRPFLVISQYFGNKSPFSLLLCKMLRLRKLVSILVPSIHLILQMQGELWIVGVIFWKTACLFFMG